MRLSGFVLIIISACSFNEGLQVPYLSDLNATADSPLYSTYAAAIERSEFVLDEGYSYNYFSEDDCVSFTTDTGGDLCLGFLINGKWTHDLRDYYERPVITLSYPDMVFSHYYPVAGLKVTSRFLVESSGTALHEIMLENEMDTAISFDIFPFMKNEYRSFNKVEIIDDSTFFFTHEEYPDSWTLSHELPYEDTIRNIFMISEIPDGSGSMNIYDKGSPSIPWYVFPDKEPVFELNGRSLINGQRNTDLPPLTRFNVMLNDDLDTIITENSPVWSVLQGAVNLDGYFRAELGNLNVKKDDKYSISIYLDKDPLLAAFQTGIIGEENGKRLDMELKPYTGIPGVKDISLDRTDEGFYLKWQNIQGGNYVTRIYRRSYPDEGTYHLVGETETGEFYDMVGADDRIYGYVLCNYDSQSKQIGLHSKEVTTLEPVAFTDFVKNENNSAGIRDFARYVSFRKNITLDPGQIMTLRLTRVVGRGAEGQEEIIKEALDALDLDFQYFIDQNEKLFSNVAVPDGMDDEMQYLYWSSFNMMRQVFYPPEGKSSYNYYVFSREPTWGWGHGGQVFHESLTIPAYALLDPVSAMNSQRVFSERQYDNGYINYRTGAYLDEIIEYNGQLTSSAPWYNYQNWELYEITRDPDFLEEMYDSGRKFYEFYVSNRDQDDDGLCEWGGHAVLESVRDAYVAVWDEVGWPSNFEALDLNCMLVMEAKALEKMALTLERSDEAERWKEDWEKRTRQINEVFWDGETGFYYHVDLKDNDFTYENPGDLKRQEIIGFLPLWAGIANKDQADVLVKKLTDPEKFWRKYGVPSLAADDPYYNDKGYWNGPVWVEWNYLIVQGLLDYGYVDEAKALTGNVANGMIIQLKKNHNLWEFYSPDAAWAGYHKTYFWAGIINKMIWDVEEAEN